MNYFNNRNSGYHGNSMSIRAVEAYEQGEMPISKWTKRAILDAIEETKILSNAKFREISCWSKEELSNGFLIIASWHHTSGAFNRTDFYKIDEDALYDLMAGKLCKPKITKIKIKKENSVQTEYVHGEYKEVEYHPYSRWNKYKETWIPFINAVIKGDWVLLPDGKRKKLANVRITARTKRKK